MFLCKKMRIPPAHSSIWNVPDELCCAATNYVLFMHILSWSVDFTGLSVLFFVGICRLPALLSMLILPISNITASPFILYVLILFCQCVTVILCSWCAKTWCLTTVTSSWNHSRQYLHVDRFWKKQKMVVVCLLH